LVPPGTVVDGVWGKCNTKYSTLSGMAVVYITKNKENLN
jgi:hypothetical protein